MPHYTEGNITSPGAMATAIINKLKLGGLTPKYVNLGSTSDAAGSMTATKATFEYTLDPLVSTQPWRFAIDGSTTTLNVYAGTAAGLPDAGTMTGFSIANFSTANAISASAPHTYLLTLTLRGLALAVYNPSSTAAGSHIVVQRPADPVSGAMLSTGFAPVFGIGSAGGSAPAFGAARESDAGASSTLYSPVPITHATQIAAQTLPDGSYWMARPANIATARALYPHELDLVQYAQEAAFTTGATPQMTLYGEGTLRTYTALPRLGGASAGGLRPLILTAGGGA